MHPSLPSFPLRPSAVTTSPLPVYTFRRWPSIYAGQYAWIALLMVAAVLYLFRNIYGEVVGALPLNGGAYNALLNTTSKRKASLAACLTLLSYMATAVISATEAMHYVNHFWQGLPVMYATVGLLAFFMGLTIMGIGESAIVAVIIFLTHLATLTLLVLVSGFYLFHHGLEMTAVIGALVGKAYLNPTYVWVFLQYFIPTISLVVIMLYRTALLEFLAYIVQQIEKPFAKLLPITSYNLKRAIMKIHSQQFVFFTRVIILPMSIR